MSTVSEPHLLENGLESKKEGRFIEEVKIVFII